MTWKIIFLGISFVLNAPALAGRETGNGGGAMVCRNADGTLKSVELLDLWEGRILKQLKIPEPSASSGTLETEYDKAVRRFSDKAVDEVHVLKVNQFAKEMRSSTIKLSDFAPKAAIAPPSDAKNGFVQKGCQIEGLALYDDENEDLVINDELFHHMNGLNQAALFLHEAIYKWLRFYPEKELRSLDSIRARNLVAKIFGQNHDEAFSLFPGPYFCRSKKVQVTVSPLDRFSNTKSRISIILTGGPERQEYSREVDSTTEEIVLKKSQGRQHVFPARAPRSGFLLLEFNQGQASIQGIDGHSINMKCFVEK